ncbi:hypothetical protein BBR47_12380 [Brevibacillus brevis NBRC 100599]|uniref:Uncharacterized protein n=1 Tax=Brevibacillus brevis (strain 47 / JCM 6285 / NBRC 100599) TaxID=358681 RepID=C0Z7H2_BREBN|nr:hypothetical protein [Brevibacillus brevis]BAH42215.1 hypothetical protein BBR47_12380 [Brevibacillus brevis NBRC 100599]
MLFSYPRFVFPYVLGETERFFSVKNVSTFFIKVDATACGQQNGHDRFVASESMDRTAE